jgi:hypothetical protein
MMELTDSEIQACSMEPAILRLLANTHEDIASDAETLDNEVRASYHVTRASELNAKADAEEREMKDRGDYAAPQSSQPAPSAVVLDDERAALMCERLRSMGLATCNEAADMVEQLVRAAPAPILKIQEAIEAALDELPAGEVVAFITGSFVGLIEALAKVNDHDPNVDIRIDGGTSRDITIHAPK